MLFPLVRDSSIHPGLLFHHALVVPKCRPLTICYGYTLSDLTKPSDA